MRASNIETLDHSWLADLWPESLRFRHAVGIPCDEEDVESSDVVPRTFQGLLGWAFVGRNPANTDVGTVFPVGIRIQGFIERCNLRPLGNLTGSTSPASALQSIVIGGGPDHEAQFFHYKAAVSEVISYIFRSLSKTAPQDARSENNTLYIARRVFTKVTSKTRHLPSVLSAGDDPMMDATAVAKDWRVTQKANVGMYVPDEVDPTDGEFVAIDPLTLGEGDFVDVCVGFDIVTRPARGRQASSVQVHLTLEHVLLLVASEKTEDVSISVFPGLCH
ncbi:hypothetical protein B0H13DRAFT_2325518 [Mycena leptocephala]|nr:hypothetical protein B0H13DRAFT_2325518 [Mycena leptocephala]